MMRLALLVGGAAGLAQQEFPEELAQLMNPSKMEELLKPVQECSNKAQALKCDGAADKQECEEGQRKQMLECVMQPFKKDMSEEDKKQMQLQQESLLKGMEQQHTTMKQVQECLKQAQALKCDGAADKQECEEGQRKQMSECVMQPFKKDMSEEDKKEFEKEMQLQEERLLKGMETVQKVQKACTSTPALCDAKVNDEKKQCEEDLMQKQLTCVMENTPGMPKEMKELFAKGMPEMLKSMQGLFSGEGMPEEMLKSMQGLFSGEGGATVEEVDSPRPSNVESENLEQATPQTVPAQ